MAMSIIALADVDSNQDVALMVKNTFLCVGPSSPLSVSTRRSSSVPPSLRHAESGKLRVYSFGSEDSTDAEAEVEAEDLPSSDAENDASSHSSASGTSTPTAVPSTPVKAPTVAPHNLTSATMLFTPPAAAPSLNAYAQAWEPAVPVTAPVATPMPAALVTAASAPPPPAGCPFQVEAAAVMATVQRAVVGRRSGVRAELYAEVEGWTLRLCVAPERLQSSDGLLMRAQQALLSAAEHSSSVYVAGYQRMPFAPLPGGFVALLSSMEDESNACWDMYGHGFCCRGAVCPRRHPLFAAHVKVVVQAAGPAAAA